MPYIALLALFLFWAFSLACSFFGFLFVLWVCCFLVLLVSLFFNWEIIIFLMRK